MTAACEEIDSNDSDDEIDMVNNCNEIDIE